MTTSKSTRENYLSDEDHNDYDNSLDDLADRINALNDQLTTANIENMISESRMKMEAWRSDCFNTINHFYEQKCREFDQHVASIIDRQRKEINRIRSSAAMLTHKQDILPKDIDYITTITHQLEHDMQDAKEKHFQVNAHSLILHENAIEIPSATDSCNPSVLPPAYKTMNFLDDSSKVLCSNERYLLIHHNSNLCLLDKDLNIVREKLWTQGWILDISWSATLARFLVLTRNYLFLVDESTMSVVRVQKVSKLSWWSCTCSDTCLFMTTKDWGSNIYQFTLWPSIQLLKRWQPPQSCKSNETINNIIFNKERVALMIYNRLTKNKSIELRLSSTFECLWSYSLDVGYDSRAIRCCLLNNDEWLIIDWNTSNICHISHDGKLKSNCDYNPSPFCAVMFGTNLLVISTVDGINLHKL